MKNKFVKKLAAVAKAVRQESPFYLARSNGEKNSVRRKERYEEKNL